jgi:hypothetical protein
MAAVTQSSPVTGLLTARGILLIDAVTCASAGLITAAASSAVADLLDAEQPPVLGTGLFLLGYTIGLLAFARSCARVQRQGLAVTAVGDALWVLASVALVIAGTFSAAGNAVVLAVALVVAAIGVTKVAALRA